MVIDFEVFAPGERLFLFFLVGHVGYLLHYVKKYSRSETTLAPVDYYFKSHFKDTLASYSTFIGALLALLFVPNDGSFASVLGLAFSAGYISDSALNRSADSPPHGNQAAQTLSQQE